MMLSQNENMVVEEALANYAVTLDKRLDDAMAREPQSETDMEFLEKMLVSETEKMHATRQLLSKFAENGEKIALAEEKAEAFFRDPDIKIEKATL